MPRIFGGSGKSQFSGAITGATIDSTPIGATTPSTIVGTTITANTIINSGDATAPVGATVLGALFQTNTSTGDVVGITKANAGTNAAGLRFFKARGTVASPTVITTGDSIANIGASAFTGTVYSPSSQIAFGTEGTIAAGQAPGNITFKTATSAGSMTTALTIDSSQVLTAAVSLKTPIIDTASGALALKSAGTTVISLASGAATLTGTLDVSSTVTAGAGGSTSGYAATVSINGSDTGSGAGALLNFKNNGSIIAAIGNNSAIFGGSYSTTLSLNLSSATGSFKVLASGGSIAAFTGVASGNRNFIFTNSNGGNPTLDVSAGSLAITPAIVAASTITATALIPSSSAIPANGLYLPGANQSGIAANSFLVATFNTVASANRSISFINASTDNPVIRAAGATDVGLYFDTLGVGYHSFRTGVGVAIGEQVRITHTASAANALTLTGGTNPTIGTSAGNLSLQPAGSETGRVTASGITVLPQTSIPAGGTAGSGLSMSGTANFGIFFGSGAPTLSAAKGSLYLRSDGTGVADRMYVNTNGSTTWTSVATAG